MVWGQPWVCRLQRRDVLGFVILSPDFVPATKGLMAQTAGTQQSPDCHENGQSLAGARGIMKLWPWVGKQELREGLPLSWGHTALPTLLCPNLGFSSKFLGSAVASDGIGRERPGKLCWRGLALFNPFWYWLMTPVCLRISEKVTTFENSFSLEWWSHGT